MKIVAHIPARHGSKRIPLKNLVKIKNKPLIDYSIETLKKSIIKDFYINTDSKKIAAHAKKKNCKVYFRKKHLANDLAKSDDFNYDFMNNIESDICVMINPVCPLLKFEEINKMVNFFIEKKLDTLISAEETQMQTFYKNKPINIKINEKLQQSQKNGKIIICNWAVTIWNSKIFLKNYKKNGYAVWGKKREFFILPKTSSIKISNLDDIRLVKLFI